MRIHGKCIIAPLGQKENPLGNAVLDTFETLEHVYRIIIGKLSQLLFPVGILPHSLCGKHDILG